jgi:hypothetical protein
VGSGIAADIVSTHNETGGERMTTSAVFGERSLSKVGAVFADASEARRAADELVRHYGLEAEQVRVVAPGDPGLSRKLEPEQTGIAMTLVKTHVLLGASGLVLGLVLATILVLTDVAAFASNPAYVFLVCAFFGAIFGMLLGGLLSLRPDHDHLINRVRKASRKGQWSVVVHAKDHDEEKRAKDALEKMSDRVSATL